MKIASGIQIHDGPCGLAFSGGADSAIMLYILLSNLKDTLHLYSFYSEKKAAIAEPITDRVLKKCIELTGNNNVIHHKEYIKEQTPMLIHGLMSDFIVRDKLTKMYTGVSKFPPDNVIEQFHENIKQSDPYAYSQRKNGLVHDVYFGQNLSFYRPIINLDKKDIAELYFNLRLEKDLFPLTRSCENTASQDQHCGECFWCQERKWGFGFLE